MRASRLREQGARLLFSKTLWAKGVEQSVESDSTEGDAAVAALSCFVSDGYVFRPIRRRTAGCVRFSSAPLSLHLGLRFAPVLLPKHCSGLVEQNVRSRPYGPFASLRSAQASLPLRANWAKTITQARNITKAKTITQTKT